MVDSARPSSFCFDINLIVIKNIIIETDLSAYIFKKINSFVDNAFTFIIP
jgi:hypothetical protein